MPCVTSPSRGGGRGWEKGHVVSPSNQPLSAWHPRLPPANLTAGNETAHVKIKLPGGFGDPGQVGSQGIWHAAPLLGGGGMGHKPLQPRQGFQGHPQVFGLLPLLRTPPPICREAQRQPKCLLGSRGGGGLLQWDPRAPTSPPKPHWCPHFLHAPPFAASPTQQR